MWLVMVTNNWLKFYFNCCVESAVADCTAALPVEGKHHNGFKVQLFFQNPTYYNDVSSSEIN